MHSTPANSLAITAAPVRTVGPSATRPGPHPRPAADLTFGEMLRARAAGPGRAPAQRTAGAGDRGAWVWPLPNASTTSPFGMRSHPITGEHRLHAGLDLAADTGAPVGAMGSGTVTYAGRRDGYGLLVEVDHGGGLTTRYAHQSRLDVAVGDRVTAGQHIGAVGATGTATGPHLHLEVRRDGHPVDPAAFIGGRP